MMINSLYQLSNKGSLRTLSFILALFLTAAFFLNLSQFSTALRTAHPAWILAITALDLIFVGQYGSLFSCHLLVISPQ